MKFLMWVPLAMINILARGVVLKILWTWFVMSQFHNVPNISVAGALGLSTLAGMFHTRMLTRKEWAERDKYKGEVDETDLGLVNAGIGIFHSVIVLGVGYLIHLFM
jgi:hypothetical protein